MFAITERYIFILRRERKHKLDTLIRFDLLNCNLTLPSPDLTFVTEIELNRVDID